MAINLLELQPNKVSRDLSGYITYIYGPGGAGKTTFGASCKKPLLLAFELGYKALPGVIAQPVQTWGEVKQVLRELKKQEVKEKEVDEGLEFGKKVFGDFLNIKEE